MTLETWLAFVAAASVMLAIPGPTNLLVMSYSLARGRRTVWVTLPGMVLGAASALALALLGLGSLLMASVFWFTVLKWAGAAYLLYLGLRMWRSDPRADMEHARDPGRTPWRMALHGYVVTVLNPKSGAFFVAFLPQFMDARAPLLPQCLVLGVTLVALASLITGGYGLLAGSLGEALASVRSRRWLNRIGGGALMGAGAMTAALRRGA